MQPDISRRGAAILVGMLLAVPGAAIAVAATPASTRLMESLGVPYRVFITEIGQTFLKDQSFVGHFATSLTMPNGTRRSIRLVPTIHDGGLVVKLDDTVDGKHVGSNGNSFMGPNGTTINGTPAAGEIMVALREMDHPDTVAHLASHAGSPPRVARGNGDKIDPRTARFEVSIYQVEKTVAFGAPLLREYSASLAGAHGSPRDITLTPEQRDGKTVVRFDDGGKVTDLPLDDPVVSGNLVVSVADMRPAFAAFEKYCTDGSHSPCRK
jgi:hypothetical protein